MPFPNVGKRVNGRDWNYFKKFDVVSDIFLDNPDGVITFPTQGIMFIIEGDGAIEYSFNGNTVHGELVSNTIVNGLTFDNRFVTTMWFRVKSGSTGPITISVHAWATP